MDDTLRNGLWNQTLKYYWHDIDSLISYDFESKNAQPLYSLCVALWSDYFKKPIHQMGKRWQSIIYEQIYTYFNRCEWYEVYDFIEFISNNYSDIIINRLFRENCHRILTREMSAYRFVGNHIVRIINKYEIESIESAVEKSNDLVATHLVRAVELLSDRKSPDYRNSIKESISAVESLVQKTVGVKGTLGQLLEKIEEQFDLHPAIKVSFKKLYGYTSDKDGIRHAMLDEPSLDFEDAKFMLVTCSAFINYVNGKLEKNNSGRK